MAYDIYGNPLKRGHCEVHPFVGQEYPCSLCLAENEQKTQEYERYIQLQTQYYEMIQKQHYEELAKKKSLFFRIVCYLTRVINICNKKMEKYKDKVFNSIEL